MEEIGEHGGGRAVADQTFGLEDLDVGLAEALGLGVEQPAPRAADAIGLQRAFERAGLEQDREARQGSLADWGARERRQRRPQVLLGFRCDGDPLAGQQGCDPFRCPRLLGGSRIAASG
jgi:hypothetical protein